jgi:hypothetical protein
MNYRLKLEVVGLYLCNSFRECVMFCTDENVISQKYEESTMLQYDLDEDSEHEVVCNFFDAIGINEDEFLELSEEFGDGSIY